MMQMASSALKNLVSLDSSFGDIIVPILMAALDPSAVNQSHQAPAAMHALSSMVRQLLYPRPVFLKFLPELLKLSTQGIDPNDSMKTNVTLSMYINIFNWLPVRSSYGDYEDLSSPSCSSSYLSIASQTSIDRSIKPFSSFVTELTNLGPAMEEWAFVFLDKIFALSEAKDAPQKGTKSVQAGGLLSAAVDTFFGAFQDEKFFQSVLEKVIAFFKKTSAINSTKEMAKLLDSLVFSHAEALNFSLQEIFDDDVKNESCSNEKLAFRFRLIGGAFRRAGVAGAAHLPCVQRIIPLFDKAFSHTDKNVRKAACKMIKDCLKGLSSFYPSASSIKHLSKPFGNPIDSDAAVVEWYVPTPEALEATVHILKRTATESMVQMKSIFDGILSSGSSALSSDGAVMCEDSAATPSDSATTTVKKVEENILSCMKILSRSIRGAAEVLGDEMPADGFDPLIALGAVDSEPCDAVETAADVGEYEMTEPVPSKVLETGRSVIKSATAEVYEYLSQMRWKVLNFLLQLDHVLDKLPNGSMYKGLCDSIPIRSAIIKAYQIVVKRRMASLKDVDNTFKWFNMAEKLGGCVLVKHMQKLAKRYKPLLSTPESPSALEAIALTMGLPTTQVALLRQKSFWDSHDKAFTSLMDRGKLQHAKRQKELSFASVRLSVKGPQGRVYLDCLKQLTTLCGHEYDNIRKTALETFQSVGICFGWRMMDIVKSLITALGTPGTSYSTASGAITILHQGLIMKRVTGQWSLASQFLRAVEGSAAMIAAVPDEDKKKKLLLGLTAAFVQYVANFHHQPFPHSSDSASNPNSAYNIIRWALKEKSSDSDLSDSIENSPTIKREASGLRHETFAAYTALHLIGHSDVKLPLGIWSWAFSMVSDANGEPSQLIAAAAVIKLSFIASYRRDTIDAETRIEIGRILSTLNWTKFISGVSRTHARASEGPQWAEGIDQILRSATFLQMILPRQLFSTTSDGNLFTNIFKKEIAGLFTCLVALLPQGLDAKTVNTIIAAVESIVPTSEEETKEIDSTKAEIFGGLCRAVYGLEPVGSSDSSTGILLNIIDREAVEQSLTNFLSTALEKVSLEYCKSWADAISFGLSGSPVDKSAVIPAFLLQNLAASLKGAGSGVVSDGCSLDVSEGHGDEVEGDGFSRQSKVLILTSAMLNADICSCANAGIAQSSIGNAVLSIFLDGSTELISPYRTSREEICSILAQMLDMHSTDVCALIAPVIHKLSTKSFFVEGSIVIDGSSAGSDEATPTNIMAVDGSFTDISRAFDSSLPPTPPTCSPPPPIDKLKVYKKNGSETICRALERISQCTSTSRSGSSIPPLFKVVIHGCGHSEIEFAKNCHEVSILISQGVKMFSRVHEIDGRTNVDLLAELLTLIASMKNSVSWHIRETVMICTAVLFVNNFEMFTVEERKLCRDIFNDGEYSFIIFLCFSHEAAPPKNE